MRKAWPEPALCVKDVAYENSGLLTEAAAKYFACARKGASARKGAWVEREEGLLIL